MATSTPYLNLVKPAYSETADIGVLNENADKIDQAVSGQAQAIAGKPDNATEMPLGPNDTTPVSQAIAGKPDDATEMPLGPNDTTPVSQAITNLQNEIGIVCTGNTCAISASIGQYVVLKNSTISGRTDGLYTAAKTIPANTVIDSTYLTAVPSGGMNDLQGQVSSLNSNINIITTRVTIPDTSVGSGTFVTIATISVNAAGTYLIDADLAFGAGDGIRILLVDTSETDVNNAANSVLATGRAALQKIRLFTLTPSDRIYIRAYQNTNSSLSVGGSYQILRLR